MKKRIASLVVVAALLMVGGGFALENVPTPAVLEEKQTAERFRLGSEAVAEVRKDYRDGKFDSFFKEMDSSYEEVSGSGALNEFASLRLGDLPNQTAWFEEMKKLQSEKNEELKQVVLNENSTFSEKVKSVAVATSPDEESAQKALMRIHRLSLGQGKNSDENALIKLDLEYEYKAVHLDIPKNESDLDLRKKHFALKMEMMDKMLLASQSFEDVELKNAVAVFAQNLDAHLARSWDLMDLHLLAKGQIKALDKSEERVVSVIQAHLEKVSDLARRMQ